MVTVRVPLRTGRGLNDREHHMTRARRVKAERYAVGILLNTHRKPQLPCVVILTRQGPTRVQLDGDNLQGALKAVRDVVANWLGVDDADERVRWEYMQAKSKWWAVVIQAQGESDVA
jgi:hypothetical protein